jgi:hypothetical protein
LPSPSSFVHFITIVHHHRSTLSSLLRGAIFARLQVQKVKFHLFWVATRIAGSITCWFALPEERGYAPMSTPSETKQTTNNKKSANIKLMTKAVHLLNNTIILLTYLQE